MTPDCILRAFYGERIITLVFILFLIIQRLQLKVFGCGIKQFTGVECCLHFSYSKTARIELRAIKAQAFLCTGINLL